MSNYQKKFKDRLFTFIFGRDSEQSKRWRLDLYNAHIKSRGENILSSRKIMLPTPKYVVFYNGLKEAQETWKMRLSDSFKKNPEPGDFEWIATAININRDHNKELLSFVSC